MFKIKHSSVKRVSRHFIENKHINCSITKIMEANPIFTIDLGFGFKEWYK